MATQNPDNSSHHLLRAEGSSMKNMAMMMLDYVLPFFAWRTRLSPELESTRGLSPPNGAVDAAVQEPERALLGQDEADLESGGLEAPPLTRQASDQTPVRDVVVARALQRRQLPTTANRTSRVTGEGEPVVGLTHRVLPLRSGGSAQVPAKLRQSLAYSFFIICLAAGTLIDLFVVRRTEEPLSKSPSLLSACASAFTSLISAIGLITFDIVKQIMTPLPRSHLIRDNTCSWSKLFFWMSTVSLTSTVLSIIASFLPKAYYILTVAFVPTLLLVVVSLSRGRQRDADVPTLGDDDPHKDDRERSFQLALSMTGFSFMGALGTKIGEHKNYSNRASPLYVNISIYFMVGAVITGLVTLLFSRLQRRKDWKKTAVGNAIVLVLVVPAVLMVAATFLGGVVLAATLLNPVAVAASIWFFFECYAAGGDLDAAFTREEEMKLLYTGAMAMMSVSFGAVMTIFSGFLGGGESKGGRLESALVFFVVVCFISSVSLGVVTFRPPKKASVGAAAMALAFLAVLFLVLAALAMVSYVG